jgi:DNA-3-methyladenine glycosylase
VTGRREARPPPSAPGTGPARAFPRSLLEGPTLDAARGLLGARLVRDPVPASEAQPARERRVGRIVEVEAYIGEDDRASHARFGRTDRNRVMFGPPGIAYVYLVYGMHHCLNVVTEPAGRPAALLVRAVEPMEGIEAMRAARDARAAARGRAAGDVPRHVPDARLTAGPALVAAAFDITRGDTGVDLCDPGSPLRLEAPVAEALPTIRATSRIGIPYAGEPWTSLPWRLVIDGSPSLSGRGR